VGYCGGGGTTPVTGSLSSTLADATLSAFGSVKVKAALSRALDSVSIYARITEPPEVLILFGNLSPNVVSLYKPLGLSNVVLTTTLSSNDIILRGVL
jgi:hypothetical protein